MLLLKLVKVLSCSGNLTYTVNAVHSKSGYFGQTISRFFKYTLAEPPKKPLRPINRLPRTDRYKKTAYNRLF
jgi:hypothetical protein